MQAAVVRQRQPITERLSHLGVQQIDGARAVACDDQFNHIRPQPAQSHRGDESRQTAAGLGIEHKHGHDDQHNPDAVSKRFGNAHQFAQGARVIASRGPPGHGQVSDQSQAGQRQHGQRRQKPERPSPVLGSSGRLHAVSSQVSSVLAAGGSPLAPKPVGEGTEVYRPHNAGPRRKTRLPAQIG